MKKNIQKYMQIKYAHKSLQYGRIYRAIGASLKDYLPRGF
jgi:hypothetical protein